MTLKKVCVIIRFTDNLRNSFAKLLKLAFTTSVVGSILFCLLIVFTLFRAKRSKKTHKKTKNTPPNVRSQSRMGQEAGRQSSPRVSKIWAKQIFLWTENELPLQDKVFKWRKTIKI